MGRFGGNKGGGNNVNTVHIYENFKNKFNQNPRTYKIIKEKAIVQRKSSYLALTKP